MNKHGRNVARASFVLTFGLLSSPAVAATRVVDQDGQASATNCNAANAAFVSIGAAVAAAVGGDTTSSVQARRPTTSRSSSTRR